MHEEALIALGIALSRLGVSCERFLDAAHISEHLLEALADGDLAPDDLVRLRHPA